MSSFPSSASVSLDTLPEFGKTFGTHPFPLFVTPKIETNGGDEAKKDLCTWLTDNHIVVDDLLRSHGGLLFRNFGLATAQDMNDIVVSSQLKGMDYIGGAAVRTQLTERVFTANESPSSENIPFHHEMAQVPFPPTHLFFFCEQPPLVHGETPILESSEVCRRLAALHPAFMEKLESLGVQYVRVLPEEDDPTSAIGRGWKSTFLTSTREGAEAALRELGSTWEWMDDGSLRTVTKVLPAVRVGNERTQSKSFFNSVVAAYTGWNDSRNRGRDAVVFGDGSAIDPRAMDDAVALMDDICVAFPWQQGDLLLLDNRTVMHSRRPFTGPRRILASLARDPDRF